MRVGIFGTGRLGSAIADVAGERKVWQVSRAAPPSPSVCAVDVAIEASTGAVVAQRLDWALEHRVPLVIGTTGWSIPDLAARVGDRIGVIVAPNFSLTIALYSRFATVLARFAQLSETRDPYLVEHHHARKKDAPSGTAAKLAATILAACPKKTEWAIPAVGGAVAPHQLSVSSIRAGYTYSSHIVGVDSPGEVIEIHHAARSARPYAEGAVDAAEWLLGKRGVFTMDDVARARIAPLFRGIDS
jgi:4-hydroxy-tetrahydrodipicolinate reductase